MESKSSLNIILDSHPNGMPTVVTIYQSNHSIVRDDAFSFKVNMVSSTL